MGAFSGHADVSRRGFIKGSLASLASASVGGLRVFAAPPGWKPAPKPNIVFGVLSDTHLQTGWDGITPHRGFPHTYVENAMKYFRSCGIDAFVHLGDMAHRGKVEEAQYHRDIFERTFPKGALPDGRKVEKLLVVGNHEWFGEADGFAGASAKNVWKDPVERAKHTLCSDMPAQWSRVWGEKYEPVWHKEVGGYHFFGRHWDVDEMALSDYIRSRAEELPLKGDRPFFILSHRRHHFQFFNSLREFPNAIAFFGHWHQSNADWKTIYFDSFGGIIPSIQCASCRMDGGNALDCSERLLKEDAGSYHTNVLPSRQGLVVSVYDMAVVVDRREFGKGGSLGPKWVFPVGKFKPHAFSRETLKRRIGEPQFQDDAKLVVGKAPGDALKLTIPLADGNPKSRAYAYDVVVAGEGPGPKLFKSVYWEGCNLGVGHEPAGGATALTISKKELPPGNQLTIAVRPVSSLGTKGRAIGTKMPV